MKHGLLLINLGTPDTPNLSSVRRFLRQFLSDKRVISLPALLRYFLVYVFILPFRAKRSMAAYQTIWTAQGSPLLIHSQHLVTQVQENLGKATAVVLGMRYGNPSIGSALNQLKHCQSITILPLYPQYSSAASGSSIAEVMRTLSSWEIIPSIKIISHFFQHPAYIKAQSQLIKELLEDQMYVLFSYHGIPERQILQSSCSSICAQNCPTLTESNQDCYRAQCYENTRLLAKELGLSINNYSTCFQSRLGKTPWVKPYTDLILPELIAKGIKNLLIVCPSFVTDCLETLEEIGIRLKEQWISLGGNQFIIVPSMNSHPLWVKAIIEVVQHTLPSN